MGTVTSSLILRKLASYPRQNALALALRELGRIERTLFTLDWLLDKDLRQRVTAGLNKGELKNSLAKAVCFNRLGELRDRSFEAQRHRASGLNLLVDAIILWNTVYLERAIGALRQQGRQVDESFSRAACTGRWLKPRETRCVATMGSICFPFWIAERPRLTVRAVPKSITRP